MKRLAFPLLGIIFTTLVFLPIVRAEQTAEQGVRMTVFNGFPDPNYQPWVDAPTGEPCFDAVVPQINADWGGGPAAEGCDADFFLVHYTGWLTVPESGAYEFLALVDDGWRMTINGQLVNDNWVLKGCGGWWSGGNEGFIELIAGVSYPLDAWMYEWGGGACAILWYGSPTNYGVVPTEWLTTSAQPEPSPSVLPSESPIESPSPEASQTPSVEPTPTPTEQPTPEPSPNPTPTQEPTYEPSPTPIPSPTPTPKPSTTPQPSPEPSPSESPSPDPTPVPSDSPSLTPSVEPEPSPSASPDTIADQAAAAVGEAVAAVGEAVSAVVGKIANLGKDLSPEEKKKAAPVAVAVVISQVASAAVAAASSAASAARKVDK